MGFKIRYLAAKSNPIDYLSHEKNQSSAQPPAIFCGEAAYHACYRFFYTLIITSNNISISFHGYRTKSISLYREGNKKRAIPTDFTIFNKIHVSITKKISKKWQNIGSLQPNYRRILWKIYVRERSDRSFLLDYVFIMRSTGVERPFFFT